MSAQGTLPPGAKDRYPFQQLLRFRSHPVNYLSWLAREYGDVAQFPIGPRRAYLLVDPEDIRDILVTHAERFTKGQALRRADTLLGNGLLTSEGDFHRKQRQMITPALHPNRVATYAADIVRVGERFCATWRDGQQIDVHEAMLQLALQVVAKALFDTELAEEVQQIGQAVAFAVRMFDRAMMPWGPLLGKLPLPSNRRFKRGKRYLDATVQAMIDRRHGAAFERGDLLSILLAARDETGHDGMSDDQARDEALTLFLAGHETTANAMTFVWHLLGQPANRQAAERLRDEARAAAGNDVGQLPYTRAVVAEAMRLYPPAWAVGRQAVVEHTVRGYPIPPASLVLLSTFVTQRDVRYWPDPLRFDPDRWLGEPRDGPKYSYFPFGGGPRSCIGEAFAWTELVLLVATIARRWRLEPAGGFELTLRPTITLRPRAGLPMTLRSIPQ